MLALLCYYILTQPNPGATAADARELEARMQAKEDSIADVARFADSMEAARQLALRQRRRFLRDIRQSRRRDSKARKVPSYTRDELQAITEFDRAWSLDLLALRIETLLGVAR